MGHSVVVTANGDTYDMNPVTTNYAWSASLNVFSGPTPVKPETWGSVKARYR